MSNESPEDASEKASIWEKVMDPQMMNNVITLKRTVCLTEVTKLDHLSDLYPAATARDEIVPRAADSVGVAIPVTILPTTTKKILIKATRK